MRGPAFAICSLIAAWSLSGCSSDATSKPSIESGEYSGVSAAGQSLVIDVVGDKVRVNAVNAVLTDPTTNAEFTASVGGSSQEFTCTNGDDGHTLSCAVKRPTHLHVQVPCNLVAAPPSPSATSSATPSASPSSSQSSQAALPSAAASLCPVTLPNSETISLLHLCSTAPCPDQSS